MELPLPAPTLQPTLQPTFGFPAIATGTPTGPTVVPTPHVPTVLLPTPPPSATPVPLRAFVSGLNRTAAEVIVGPRNTVQDLVSSPTIEFSVSTNLPALVLSASSSGNGFRLTAVQPLNSYTTLFRGYWFANAGTNAALSITVSFESGGQTAMASVVTNVSSRYPDTRPVYLSTSPVTGDYLYSLSPTEGLAAGYTAQARNWAFRLYTAPVVTSQMQANAEVHRCRWVNAPAFHFVNLDHCAGQHDEGVLGYAMRVGSLPLSVNFPGGSFFRIYRVYWPSGPRAVTDYNGWYRMAEHPELGVRTDIDYGVMVLN